MKPEQFRTSKSTLPQGDLSRVIANRSLVTASFFALAVLFPQCASTQPSFRKILDGGGPPVYDGNHVAYVQFGFFGGVFLYVADIETGSRTTVATHQTSIPGGGGQLFSGFGGLVLSGNQLAFIGDGPGAAKTGTAFNGVYLYDIPSRSLTKVVDVTDIAPKDDPEDPDVNFGAIRDLDFENGRLVFSTNNTFSLPGRGGVYIREGGGIKKLVDDQTVIPAEEDIGGATQFFDSFGNVATNGADAVFTVGARSPGFSPEGMYKKGLDQLPQELPDLILDSRNLNGGSPAFRFFSVLDMDTSFLAFRGSHDQGEDLIGGFYRLRVSGGGQQLIADQNTPVPGNGMGNFSFNTFIQGALSIDNGFVVFGGSSDAFASGGVFSWNAGAPTPLLQAGDVLDGATVQSISVRRNAISGGRIAVHVVFQGFETAVYLIDPFGSNVPNLFIRDIEIQQAVPEISRVLVDRPILVRVRPGVSIGTQSLTRSNRLAGVTAKLHVLSDSDLEIPGSPFDPTGLPVGPGLVSKSGSTMTVRGDGSVANYEKTELRTADDTINFMIPPLPSIGRYRFFAEINPDSTIFESNFNDNRFPSVDGVAKRAVATRPLNLLVGRFRLVPLTNYPDPARLLEAGNMAKWAYPLETGELNLILSTVTYPLTPNIVAPAILMAELKAQLELHNALYDPNADFALLVGEDKALLNSINFFSSVEANGVAVPFAGVALVEDDFGTYESTVSHEVGHLLSLGDTYSSLLGLGEREVNPRDCPDRCTDNGNRLDPGGYNPFLGEIMGYDPLSRVITDFMGNSGNSQSWVDRISWVHLLDQFQIGLKSEGDPRYLIHKGVDQQFAFVSGSVLKTESETTGILNPISLLTSNDIEFSTPPAPGSYHLRFRDGAEQELLDWSFNLFEAPPPPGGGPNFDVFSFVIPLPDGTMRIDFDLENTTLNERAASANPPSVQILSPSSNDSLEGEVMVSWSGEDVDGDPLSYTLLYSSPEENQVLITNVTEDFFLWETSIMVSAQGGTLQIIASDGLLTASDEVTGLTVTGGGFPKAVIDSPFEGARFPEWETVLLQGSSLDPGGREINYSWSVDGGAALGEGEMLPVSGLGVGQKTIRLEAMANGETGTAQVGIEVYADGDRDRIPDDFETDHGLNPSADDSGEDTDGDGLEQIDEWRAGSSPNQADTDGDGTNDGDEWEIGSSPSDASETPATVWSRLADIDGDGRVGPKDMIAWQRAWRQAGMTGLVDTADFDNNSAIDQRDGLILLEVFDSGGETTAASPTPAEPSATPTPTSDGPASTPTVTLTPMVPTPTPSAGETVAPTPSSSPTEPSSDPTKTPIPGSEIFQSGDAFIDFSVFPDGSPMSGEDNLGEGGFSPGTYLTDQFSSVGVTFHSTRFGSTDLMDVGIGVIGGNNGGNNLVQGMRFAPPNGLDGRTVWEIRFSEPVRRAGIQRRGLLNYNQAEAITNFYREDGGLIFSLNTQSDLSFVSIQVDDGQPSISRIEITSTDPNGSGAGGGDNLFFSQVGALPIPPALSYNP